MLSISWSTLTTALVDGDLVGAPIEHTLQFDAVSSEVHEGSSVLSEHAVGEGSPITSHKRANPKRLTIEAVVTNTPLGLPPPSGYGAGSPITQRLAGSNDNAIGGAVLVYSATFDRMGDVEATLDRLRLEATNVTISTRIRTYENMQIVAVSIPRKPDDGDSLTLTIECQQVRIARSRTVASPIPREPRGAPERDRGGQEGEDSSTGGTRTSSLQAAREEYERSGDLGAAFGAAFGA